MEAKPLASLTSGLLARKGQAKPAMRPQGFAGFGMGQPPRDDLGWNDMGYDVPLTAPAEPVAPTPVVAAVPPVLIQREELAREIAAPEPPSEPEIVPEIVMAAAPRPRAPKRQALDAARDHRKAAFTLRLDGDRHLKLRLATAVRNRSAQQLVTQALDEFLARIPELDDLAGRLPPRGNA